MNFEIEQLKELEAAEQKERQERIDCEARQRAEIAASARQLLADFDFFVSLVFVLIVLLFVSRFFVEADKYSKRLEPKPAAEVVNNGF